VSMFDILEYTAVMRNRVLSDGTGSLIGAHGYCYSAAWFLLYYTMSGPCVSLLFGVYLFTCVTFMGAHWDTGYSSLQIEHYKSFVRFHLKPSGDLEVFVIGLDQVPSDYRLDPKWGARHLDLLPTATPESMERSSSALNSPPSVPSVSPKIHGINGARPNKMSAFDLPRAGSTCSVTSNLSSLCNQWEVGSSISDSGLDTTALPPSYMWSRPSRWIPEGKHSGPKIVDQFIIPKTSETVQW
jgi:hypothetical protein